MKLKAICIILLLMTTSLFANDNIDVQGHRGARAVLPENTLPAFEYALNLGVDTLELDMGVSKDGVVVISHDQEINPVICQSADGRKAAKGLLIHSLTLAEIKAFDCGTKRNPKFPKQTPRPGAQIPTLEEVFKLVANSSASGAKSVRFNIETKSKQRRPSAQPVPADFVRLVLEVVKKYDLEKRVTLQSFDHRTLLEAKKQAPELELAVLFEKKPKDWVAATQAAKADIVSPNHKHIDSQAVSNIHAAGLRVIPWTANRPKQWQRLLEMQVDGIITDDPEPLLEFLGRR